MEYKFISFSPMNADYTALPSGDSHTYDATETKFGDDGSGPLLPTSHPVTTTSGAKPLSFLDKIRAQMEKEEAEEVNGGPSSSSEVKSQSLQSVLLGEGFLKNAFSGNTEARETQRAMLDAMRRADVNSEGGLHTAHVGDWTNGEIAGGSGTGSAKKSKGWALLKQSVATRDDRVQMIEIEELSEAAQHVNDGQHDRPHESVRGQKRWHILYHAPGWLMVYFAACLVQLCLAAVEKPSPALAAMANGSSSTTSSGNGSGNGGNTGGATGHITTAKQWDFQMAILGVDVLCVLTYAADILIRFKLVGATVASFFATSTFGQYTKIRFAIVLLMLIDDGVAWATAFNCIRFSRFLRPLMIILRFRQIRMVFMGYLKAIPSMLSVLLLILLMVTFYALTGFLLFHHDDRVSARLPPKRMRSEHAPLSTYQHARYQLLAHTSTHEHTRAGNYEQLLRATRCRALALACVRLRCVSLNCCPPTLTLGVNWHGRSNLSAPHFFSSSAQGHFGSLGNSTYTMLLLSQSIPSVLPALNSSYYTSPWSAVFFVTFQGTKSG